jgi:DNA-binding CsgD family transcriptional regulator
MGRRSQRPHDRAPAAAGPRVTSFVLAGETFAVVSVPLADRPNASLTEAENQVMDLACQGLSNAEIAAQRGTAVRTVANQLGSIYAKLAVASRSELIATRTRGRRRS